MAAAEISIRHFFGVCADARLNRLIRVQDVPGVSGVDDAAMLARATVNGRIPSCTVRIRRRASKARLARYADT